MQSTDAPYIVSAERTHSTVTIRPSLTEAEWADIEKAGNDILNQIKSHNPKALVVDLSPLEYMGSSMVAMIVRCWKSVNGSKQRFVVVTSSDVVRQVLELSGLAKMWTIAPTMESGLRSVGINSGSSGGGGYSDSKVDKYAVILGSVALVVAIVGMVVWFARPAQHSLATGLLYGGGAGAFVLGLIAMMLSQSKIRFIGLALVLLGAGAGLFRVTQSAPASAATAEEEKEGETDSEATEEGDAAEADATPEVTSNEADDNAAADDAAPAEDADSEN